MGVYHWMEPVVYKARGSGFKDTVIFDMSQALVRLGTAANVLGVITPVKDLAEVIKGIADTLEEVSHV